MTSSESAGSARSRARGLALAAAPVAALALLALPATAQQVDRLVLVMDPLTAETNLFWGTAGDLGLDPSMHRLVGNDRHTGEFTNTALAESWEHNDDFTEWTFRLKPEAEWHFGWGPVTAHDVVHSHDLHTGEDSVLTGKELLRAQEVEALDDHTVVFRFDQPRIDYLFVHAGRGSMYVYSKAQYDAEGIEGYLRLPAGTGPYQYKERIPGTSVIYERVEDHWSGIRPDFPEFEMRFVAEHSTKLALLLAGEAHIADLPREIQGQAIQAGKEIVTSQNIAMQVKLAFNGLYMQSGDPAFNPDLPWVDIRVREAMNRALDRDTIIDVAYDGRAQRLVRYNMHDIHEGYLPELEERYEAWYGYDPERAKELLAEAGYPDAFPDPVIPIVSIHWPGNPEWPTLAELAQVYFEEIGLQTELREMDAASLGALGRGRQLYMINPIRNAPIRPTELGLRNSYTNEGSVFHGFEDDRINELIAELRATIDPEERRRIAQEAFVYAFEQYADMPIAGIFSEVVVDPSIVAGWTFPGVTSVGTSHWHLIEAAR
jgi:peptide/nickel transport system substrate-binding protein